MVLIGVVFVVSGCSPAFLDWWTGREAPSATPQATMAPTPTPAPTAAPEPSTALTGPIYAGVSSWYCGSICTRGYEPTDLVAAIDPTLGIERGSRLLVSHAGVSIAVTVVDVCGCPGERIIDLSSGAFGQLADPSRGLIRVTVELID